MFETYPVNISQIKSKADLVKWAVEFTAQVEGTHCERRLYPDYVRAQELIDFFNKNVELPEVSNSGYEEVLNKVVDLAKQKVENGEDSK